MPNSSTRLYVGTYAKPGGRGLYPLRLAADGALAVSACAAPAINSSFGAWSPRKGVRYLVDECDSRLAAWGCEDGAWQQLARVPTAGREPCYVALDEDARRLAVANYASGSLAVFGLDDGGLPAEPPSAYQDAGRGPVEARQEGPHVHCVRFGPDGRSLYATDLGADHILRLELEGAAIADRTVAYHAPPGSGPRHLLFHPSRPFALLISELASTLTLLRIADNGTLASVASCSTLPAGWRGDNLGGHLEWPTTERAYVSNRGHDSLALIAVDLHRAALNVAQHVPSGGKSPRHFALVNEASQLVVAHEKDGTVASFRLDREGSLGSPLASVTVPGACYVFAASDPEL